MEGGTTEVVAVATVFGMVVTKTVDLFRNAFDKEAALPGWLWNLAAFGLGVAMALIWQINMLDNYSDENSFVQGITGRILTGIAIGGVSSGYHEFFDALSSTAKRAKFGDEAADIALGRPVRTGDERT